MRRLLLLLLLTSFSALSQSARAQAALDTIAPKDPAYDKLVKAFGEADGGTITEVLPGLEKKYPNNAQVRFFRGLHQQMIEGDPNAALRTYSEVLKTDPKFVEALMFRASIFADKGLYDKAIVDATGAIDASGGAAERYKDRGDYYYKAGQFDKAADDFMQASKKEPDNAGYYRGAANAMKQAGKASAVDAMYKSALEGSAVKQKGGVYASYGEYLLGAGRFEESKTQFTKAFASNGFQPTGNDYNMAAISHLRTADRAGAETFMDKAIAADSKNVDYILNRADIAIEAEQWERVYSLAQQALALNAEHPKANMMMAVGIKRTNRGDALASEYETKAKKLAAEQGVE